MKISAHDGTNGVVKMTSRFTSAVLVCPVITQWRHQRRLRLLIDILNNDCRRSISAILTMVPENVKISARPLNSIGN